MKRNNLLCGLLTASALLVTACGGGKAAETTAAPETTKAETAAAETTAAETEAESKAEKSAEAEALPEDERIIVSVDWVKDVLDDQVAGYENAVIAEGSWGPAADNEGYTSAHIPGAIHINTDDIESSEKWNFYDYETLSKNLASYGVTAETPLIVYGGDAGAARVAFAAMYAGVENIKLMDGSITAWENAGYETETGVVEPVAAESFGLTEAPHPEEIISCEDVRAKLGTDENFKLISIRSPEEYRGETSGYSYIDYAGEPEGAVWGHAGKNAYDMSDYMNEDGSYVDYETVLGYMTEAGVTPENESAFYCGTGWRACIPYFILHDAGWKNIELYDGGWFEWLMHPDYPVQVGEPGSSDFTVTTVSELEPGKAA